MTTVRQATREQVAPSRPPQGSTPGSAGSTSRTARRLEHRRLVREELAAVLVLAVLLAVTLVLLALQWLATGTPTAAGPFPPLHGGLA